MLDEPAGIGDTALVADAVSGDHEAFAALYRRHRDRVFCVVLGVVGEREAALDVTQDVFVKLMGVLDRYDGRAAFTTWLHRVAVNAAYDMVRKRTPVPAWDPHAVEGAAEAFTETDSDAAVDIHRGLAGLPADQRAVLVMVDMLGYGYEEAASVLGVPVGTVKSRLARGRIRLAETISAGNNEVGSRRRSSGGPEVG